jgi:hypothetical protein
VEKGSHSDGDSGGYARLPVQGQNALLHARNHVLQHPGTSWGLHPMCFGIERLQVGPVRAGRRGLRHQSNLGTIPWWRIDIFSAAHSSEPVISMASMLCDYVIALASIRYARAQGKLDAALGCCSLGDRVHGHPKVCLQLETKCMTPATKTNALLWLLLTSALLMLSIPHSLLADGLLAAGHSAIVPT